MEGWTGVPHLRWYGGWGNEVSSMVMLSLKNEVMRYHRWFYQTLDCCLQLFQVFAWTTATCDLLAVSWNNVFFNQKQIFNNQIMLALTSMTGLSLCLFGVQPKIMVMNMKQLWHWFFTLRWSLYWPWHYGDVCLVEVRGGDIINYHQVIIIIIDQATRYWPQMITKMIMAIIRLTTTLTFVWSWAAEEVAAVII